MFALVSSKWSQWWWNQWCNDEYVQAEDAVAVRSNNGGDVAVVGGSHADGTVGVNNDNASNDEDDDSSGKQMSKTEKNGKRAANNQHDRSETEPTSKTTNQRKHGTTKSGNSTLKKETKQKR